MPMKNVRLENIELHIEVIHNYLDDALNKLNPSCRQLISAGWDSAVEALRKSKVPIDPAENCCLTCGWSNEARECTSPIDCEPHKEQWKPKER